jgi:translocator protein
MNYDNDWYDNLIKPKFQPPSWIFAPVWMGLYIIMFAALFVVIYSSFKWSNIFAYLFFSLQMLVNLSWTPAFFIEHDLRKAFLITALLNFLVFLTMLSFFHASIWQDYCCCHTFCGAVLQQF